MVFLILFYLCNLARRGHFKRKNEGEKERRKEEREGEKERGDKQKK
jgi:hypothetical protein